MQLKTDLFINGQWVKGAGSLPVMNPSTGELIAEISTADQAQCDAALTAAHDAFPAWAKTPSRVRSEILRKAFEIMTAESDQIARLISMENGKTFTDAKGEVSYAAEFFRWFAEEAVRTPGDFRHSPSGDKRILVTHQPIGVSLLITPWNFPAAMATRKIGPALAAGCTVILKAASETPLTAIWIVDIMHRAGVPAGVVNFIMPEKTGAMISRMMHDPRLRNVSFTGSTEVGRILIKESADLVLRTSLELGGNAPFVVLDDADIDEAVKGAMVA
ncbi:MAG: aldehyde dehydrogenase family protein, partial [Actinomycetes bacterium]